MDGKKTASASRPAARTPQPPPPVNTTTGASSTTKPRSRSSTPTAPSVAALAGSRASNGSTRQSKTKSNNNSSSPRVNSPGSRSSADEPATEDDEFGDRSVDSSHEVWMRQSEATLAVLEKQVQEATTRNHKHQTRCASMRDSIVGKEERMGTLQGTYASLNREIVELEALSSGDYDSDSLDEMFMSIPADQRVLPAANTE